MKFNLKMIAVAAAMVSAAGASHAALTDQSSATTNNGSLALVAFNTVSRAFYIRDTGLLLNSFLPSSVTTLSGDGAVTGDKTPAAGLTLTKASAGYSSFGDSNFSTWLSGQTQSDVKWFFSGVDNSGTNAASSVKRFLTSSANSSQTATNGQLDNYIGSGNAGGIYSVYQSGSNGPSASTKVDGAPGAWDTNFGLDATSAYLASLGDSVGLFYFARSAGTGATTTAAATTQFGNATGYATVKLAANGDFTYALAGAPVSAVPVPAAAWLFGSGLLSLGAFVRRRTAK
jgi:hypothetical protein